MDQLVREFLNSNRPVDAILLLGRHGQFAAAETLENKIRSELLSARPVFRDVMSADGKSARFGKQSAILPSGIKVIFRTANGPMEHWCREYEAYQLDRQAGFYIMPTMVIRTFNGKTGVLELWDTENPGAVDMQQEAYKTNIEVNAYDFDQQDGNGVALARLTGNVDATGDNVKNSPTGRHLGFDYEKAFLYVDTNEPSFIFPSKEVMDARAIIDRSSFKKLSKIKPEDILKIFSDMAQVLRTSADWQERFEPTITGSWQVQNVELNRLNLIQSISDWQKKELATRTLAERNDYLRNLYRISRNPAVLSWLDLPH